MADKLRADVSGIAETNRALEKVGDFDIERAENEAGKAVLGKIRANTRRRTGSLASGWQVDNGTFINTVEYAPYQEFGTESVSPTFAIFRAWESEEASVVKAFEKEIESAASRAGFDT